MEARTRAINRKRNNHSKMVTMIAITKRRLLITTVDYSKSLQYNSNSDLSTVTDVTS